MLPLLAWDQIIHQFIDLMLEFDHIEFRVNRA